MHGTYTYMYFFVCLDLDLFTGYNVQCLLTVYALFDAHGYNIVPKNAG